MTAKLRVLKSWLDQDYTLIFQVQIIAEKGLYPKKCHLLLDLRQNSFGARLSLEKPAQASAQNAFVQILRKQLPSFTIKQILQDPAHGDLWLPLLSGAAQQGPWYLRLTNSRPPQASLLDPEQTAFVSYGQKGTFTKKRQEELIPAKDNFIDILPDLMKGLESQHLTEESTEAEAEHEGEDEGSPLPQAQKDLIARLKRKLKTSKKGIEKLRSDLPEADDIQRMEKSASLLQSYAYLVREGDFKLHLDPAQTGEADLVTIELDPEKSVGKNIEEAFEKFRKTKKKRLMNLDQIKQSQDLIDSLERDIQFLRETTRSEADWEQIIRRYRLPDLTQGSGTKSSGPSRPYKTYTTSTGHEVLVGKGASENDELTKAARSNDYWLHAVGVTGSHVVIPLTPDLRQSMPAAVLREASILALHFSSIKGDFGGECYVTRKAHVKKQKGMPPGLWRIDQSETIFVKYNVEELNRLLGTIRN